MINGQHALHLPDKGHRICPYLLRDVVIERPNQVWATDVTYLPMAKGFADLAAILDLDSRKVLAFRVSNTWPSISASSADVGAMPVGVVRLGRATDGVKPRHATREGRVRTRG